MVALGRLGVWSRELRAADAPAAANAASELEELGYRAIWLPGQQPDSFFPLAAAIIAGSRRIAVVSGILSIWLAPAADVGRSTAELEQSQPDRFVLGLGVSHPHVVERTTGQHYDRPLTRVRRYLDELDQASPTVPPERRILAALGPKMLELSGQRSAGAHPYFVPPEHTRIARTTLGAGPLLAPEQAVVLETDPVAARRIARRHMATYLQAINYTNNLRRLGYTEDDLAGEGSDRLVDAIVAWGDVETIGRRVQDHFDAGADHVCLQVLPATPGAMPLAEWRALASLAG